MKHVIAFLGTCMFWGFLVVKFYGHVFALWSFWWLLLPIVPWLAILAAHWGL